jgi:tetratricopeptide (TPR) repeat protein
MTRTARRLALVLVSTALAVAASADLLRAQVPPARPQAQTSAQTPAQPLAQATPPVIAAPSAAAPVASPAAGTSAAAGTSTAGAQAVYDAKDVLEHAQKLNERFTTHLSVGVALISLLIAFGALVNSIWLNKANKLQSEYESLKKSLGEEAAAIRTNAEALQSRIAGIEAEVAKFNSFLENARQSAAASGLPAMNFERLLDLDSPYAREYVNRAMERIEAHIGLEELETTVVMLGILGRLPGTIYYDLGLITRNSAQRAFLDGDRVKSRRLYRKAIRYYKLAAEQAEKDGKRVDSSDFWQIVGTCYSWIDDHEAALQATNVAIQLREQAREAVLAINYESRAYAQMRLGHYRHAEVDYRRARATSLNKPRVDYNLACNLALWSKEEPEDRATRLREEALRLLTPLAATPELRNRMLCDEDFAALRDHGDAQATFQALLAPTHAG